jgi:hypothetical protein
MVAGDIGKESLGSIRCWEILEWLRDWRLLKKDSVAWKWLKIALDGTRSFLQADNRSVGQDILCIS